MVCPKELLTSVPCVGDWRNRDLGSELSVLLLQFLTCRTVKKYFFPLLRLSFPTHHGKSIIPYQYGCSLRSVGCYTIESFLALFLFCPRADHTLWLMIQVQWRHSSVWHARGLVQCRHSVLHQRWWGLSPSVFYKFPTFFQSCLCPMLWADSVHTVSGPALYHTKHKALAGREDTSLLHGIAQRGWRSPMKSLSSCHCHNTNTTW